MTDQSAGSRIVGRSSSHFTRIVRIFASELKVPYSLVVAPDLLSSSEGDYGGNPALKLPIWQTSSGTWFGSLNICRALSRRANTGLRIVWPEDLCEADWANAQELASQAMATEVSLVMAKVTGADADNKHLAKLRSSLSNTLSWLDARVDGMLRGLPTDRDLSYLEVTLFCLVTHLQFRDVLPTAPYPALLAFCERFAGRASAQETPYYFD